jgi:Anti-sigma-K factor rskA, C-terminal
MTREPDFRDLVGDDLSPEERARLQRVHDLLIQAGPPPELTPALADPDTAEPEMPIQLPRRRAGALLALAATIALLAFLGGFLAGQRGEKFSVERSLPMHGTGLAQNASATLDLGKLDQSGNWPLRVVVRGLKPLPKHGYYEMWLTKHGRPVATCGTFDVGNGESTVRLNAPYDLRSYDGWVVTREVPHSGTHPVVLTT